MWSLFDLAPLDNDVDEKQENLDMLVEHLTAIKEDSLAKELIAFNEQLRNRIKPIHNQLPQCVIQGDLNFSNLLVADGHFKGLIDFNMAGTEVNVNHFCCSRGLSKHLPDFPISKCYVILRPFKHTPRKSTSTSAVHFTKIVVYFFAANTTVSYLPIVPS